MRPGRLVLVSLVLGALVLASASRLLLARTIALPVLARLPAFQLTDERGAVVTAEAMRGKINLVDFIFTSCSAACPMLTAELGRQQAQLRARGLADRVRLWSISVDPARDSPERLRAYAAEHGADPAVWRFLRGDEAALRRVVVEGMKQEVERQLDRGETDGFTILHGTKLVLIDGEARIRGYYEAKDPAALLALAEALGALAEGRAEVEGEIALLGERP